MAKRNGRNKLHITTLVLALIACGLLLFGTVGGTRAALQIFSNDYDSHIDMKHIGITLNESNEAGGANPVPVSSRDYHVGAETLEGNWVTTGGTLLTNLLSAQVAA